MEFRNHHKMLAVQLNVRPRNPKLTCLPPASEGWGRSCFHWCLSFHRGDYSSPRFFPRSLVLCPFQGGTPVPGSFHGLCSQVLSRGVPQFWPRGTSVLGQDWGLGYPQLGLGYPQPWQDWGTPWARTGVPPGRTGLGYTLGHDWGTSPARTWVPPNPRQNSRASPCGMPLAVTQEDFLVVFSLIILLWITLNRSNQTDSIILSYPSAKPMKSWIRKTIQPILNFKHTEAIY